MTGQSQRFFKKIDLSGDPDGCWCWLTGKGKAIYGRFRIGGTSDTGPGDVIGAHRYSYEYFYGIKIPSGMFIDHKCRNRSCVRPDHLRIVTPRINALENSGSPLAENHLKTHCPKGHAYSVENTYLSWRKNGTSRSCKTCMSLQSKRWLKDNKERRREYDIKRGHIKKEKANVL
jgi:hypothetical protein